MVQLRVHELHERILIEVPGATVHIEEPGNPVSGHWFVDVEVSGLGAELRRTVIEWIPRKGFGVWPSLRALETTAEAPTVMPELYGEIDDVVERVVHLLLGAEP